VASKKKPSALPGKTAEYVPPPVRQAREEAERAAAREERVKNLPARTEFAPFEITDARTDMHLAAIAYFDARNYFDEEGRPIPISELSDEAAYALAGMDVYEEWENNGRDTAKVIAGLTKKYKLSDKLKALQMINELRGRTSGTDDKRRQDKLHELDYILKAGPID